MTAAVAPTAAPTPTRVAGHERAATAAAVVQREPAVDPLGTQGAGQCACGGGCPDCDGDLGVQPKLLVGALDDPAERDADRAADAVVGGGAALTLAPGPAAAGVQRCGSIPSDVCPCHGGGSPLDAGLPSIARTPAHGALAHDHALSHGGPAPPLVGSVIGSGRGSALDPAVRSTLEARFGGADFGSVRVHTDDRAAASAAAIGARAYTLGSDVVFGAGQYGPTTTAGLHTLAHELAHVVQQGSAAHAVRGPPTIRRQGLESHPSTSGPSNVSSDKWREDAERAYRRTGFIEAANAVRGCREWGICGKILTLSEAWEAYGTGRVKANLGPPPERAPSRTSVASFAVAGVAAPVVVSPGVGGAAGTAGKTALERAALRWGTAEVIEGGAAVAEGSAAAGVASVAVPVAIGIYIIVAVVALVGWTQFQVELQRQGFVVLPDPLGACIGSCHSSAPEPSFPRDRPWTFDRRGPKFPADPDFDPRIIEEWLKKTAPKPDPKVDPKADPKKDPKTGPQPLPDPVPDEKPKRKCRPDPCEHSLPISWPRSLPEPALVRLLIRTTRDEREWEGIDRGPAQRRLSEEIRRARERLVPPPKPCFATDAEPNAPYDAHHTHPLYLGGEDSDWNLCSLRADRHQLGHPSLDNQTMHLLEYLECGICSGFLSKHPAGQTYHIVGSKWP